MVQHEVSVNCVVAWIAWSLAVITAGVAVAYPRAGVEPLSVLFTGAGAVLHVRGFIYGLQRRERQAFELGRDSVRPLR